MTDTELIDFIENRGIQLWCQRKNKYGPVMNWWAQSTHPFVQCSGSTLRTALNRLVDTLTRK